MLNDAHDDGVIIERVAAIDVGKAEIGLCQTRRAAQPGHRRCVPATAMTLALMECSDWLSQLQVTRWSWRPPAITVPVFYPLEAAGFDVAGQRQRCQHLPGRPGDTDT
ncbi:MAG: hypothetical protein M9891_03750 [Austwickia sp.]|nr:hypothetical protein [Austwickia sp.]